MEATTESSANYSKLLSDALLSSLYELGNLIVRSSKFDLLNQAIQTVRKITACDSCFLYVLENDYLVLRASHNLLDQNTHHSFAVGKDDVLPSGPLPAQAKDAGDGISEQERLCIFNRPIEDSRHTYLSVPLVSRRGFIGVIELQYRRRHIHSEYERKALSTIGVLVGIELDRTLMETNNTKLVQQLRTRKILDRAKGILQRDLNLSEEQAYLLLQQRSRQRRARYWTVQRESFKET